MNSDPSLDQFYDEVVKRVLALSPELRHDVNLMADTIRELVRLERDKAGLDENTGRIDLYPNLKYDPAQPDFIGQGVYAGNRIEAAAWLRKNSLTVTLLQKPART